MKILDACCGRRKFWVNKNHSDVVYIDVRPEVKPDFIMDCRKTAFEDKTFDLIVFDPPHISLSPDSKGIFGEKYGRFRAREIRILIYEAFIEFHRILQDDGLVIFKWNTHSQSLRTIFPLITKFEILFGQLVAQRIEHPSQTLWFTLKKGNHKKNQYELFSVG
jgi:tRNA G10  N-methylase Trm11